MSQKYERDCTSKCRSVIHAKDIFSCIPHATTSQIRAYAVWRCHNFPFLTDDTGRNILHVATSCGKWEIVEWLIKNCNVNVDVQDKESKWTALHRSFYYGQLAVARVLCILGTNMKLADRDGLTALDIILKDRLPYIEYTSSNPSEVYAWGSNFNYNLGLGHIESRDVPELLELFHKDCIYIKQVVICKFHSAFLSTLGQVFTSGYGHGGRLGQGNEEICLKPSLVKGIGTVNCLQLAAGQDHMLFLIEGGQVWSCGQNTYHQLGIVPPVEQCLIPKPISTKFLKGKVIVGIRAARFHSVIFTADGIYTFGLNAGQLGHPKGDQTQMNPRRVSALDNEEWKITQVETSDGATVCATNQGNVFVLHEYQVRKIASRQLEIAKLSVVGGLLDSHHVEASNNLELRVALLTKSGKVYLWRQTDPYLRRCLFNSPKELIILDLHLNHYSLGLISSDNEGYIGKIVETKCSRPPPSSNLHTALFSSKTAYGLNVLLNTDECVFISVKRLPHIFRGSSITSDSKGRNFAILQSCPRMGLIEIPVVSISEMQQDLHKLLSETSLGDEFHDIVIKVGKREFAAHKFILASRSDYFKKQLVANDFKNVLTINHVRPEAFEQVLKFIYTNHCDFFVQGHEISWETKSEGDKKKKSSKSSQNVNPIIVLQEASKLFCVNGLAKKLAGVKLINSQINVQRSISVANIKFSRSVFPKLCDVTLLSSDGFEFHCHKCILIARLDYFRNMLSSYWAENSQLQSLSLPISSKVMEAVLDYIYSAEASKVMSSEDPEFICHVLLVSDQLLITRLKEICEVALAQLITLKNAAELLELSSIYNSQQLKRTCMHFISINLPAIIEAKALDVVSDEVMQDLTTYYQELIPSMHRRKILGSDIPSQDTLRFVEENFPVEKAETIIRIRLDIQDTKLKGRLRTSSSAANSVGARAKTTSESSEKDIVLDMSDLKLEIPPPQEKKESLKTVVNPIKETTSVFQPEDFPNLGEQQMTVVLKKTSGHNMKPIPHFSWKQIKSLENAKKLNLAEDVSNSPVRSTCPWAKVPQQSPPSPSFWDALAKKDFDSSSNSELSYSISKDKASKMDLTSNLKLPTTEESPVPSLKVIQRDELKLHQPVVIKPLHVLNIEDKAIEELLEFYNAKNNPKEKVTVSRILPNNLTSPIWQKHSHRK